ncbi:hypothetical protein D4764_22G0002050 [Takifugu flavidus]|uniref:Uncharacterized protein n=1 Tax=Takifugu flavidus TaxID=433684 RepID=A0A5C6NCD5_9TELE|nr:hypothetical protein D4764_22G0002050 [Takifugu flavidus]
MSNFEGFRTSEDRRDAGSTGPRALQCWWTTAGVGMGGDSGSSRQVSADAQFNTPLSQHAVAVKP